MRVLKFFICLLLVNSSYSQILNVPEITQEQNQWCWAGASKCILDYYCYPVEQCEIAEYARQVIDWYDFGNTNCCVNPNLGCNYWNYAWGYPGSLQDILIHFGNIQNEPVWSYLSQAEISDELSAGRPFVIRWGWPSGGGHFLVGHGIDGNYLHYMDPWFGEGLHISTYNWVVYDGNHTWTHTIALTTNPPPFTITATAGNNGTINPSGAVTVNYGGSQTFIATPNNCYEIDEWKLNDNVVQIGGNSFTISNVQENTTIGVTFKPLAEINENIVQKIQIYPNPTNDEIFIKSELQIRKVEIYSITGALLISEKNFNEKISLSALPKGIYMVNIYTDNDTIVQKIVKE